jgi:hypothetical protein
MEDKLRNWDGREAKELVMKGNEDLGTEGKLGNYRDGRKAKELRLEGKLRNLERSESREP